MTPTFSLDIAEHAIYTQVMTDVLGPQLVYVIEQNTRDVCFESGFSADSFPELQEDTLADYNGRSDDSQVLSEIV